MVCAFERPKILYVTAPTFNIFGEFKCIILRNSFEYESYIDDGIKN